MNVNVVVFNVSQDFRIGGIGDRRRERGELFPGQSDASRFAPERAEQVIELVSRDGAWMGEGSTRTPREVPFRRPTDAKALYASAPVTTYDHEGKVRHAALDKGLRINITA